MTSKKTFLDESKTIIDKEKRESLFAGNLKIYVGKIGFEKHHHNAGARLGPGPAMYNIRDIKDGLATFNIKPTSSLKTTMNQDQRYIGQPRPSYMYPGPSCYQISST